MKNLSKIAKLINGGGLDDRWMHNVGSLGSYQSSRPTVSSSQPPRPQFVSQFASSQLPSSQYISSQSKTPSSVLFPPPRRTENKSESKETGCFNEMDSTPFVIIIMILALTIAGLCVWFFVFREDEKEKNIIRKKIKSRREK